MTRDGSEQECHNEPVPDDRDVPARRTATVKVMSRTAAGSLWVSGG